MTKEKRDEMIQSMIERVNSEVDIEDVISRYIKKRGSNYKCPFHSETTIGAFSISKTGNFFNCFGCGVGGSPSSFVALKDGLSLFEATKKLALESGIIGVSDYVDLFGNYEKSTSEKKYVLNQNTQLDLLQREKELERLQSKEVINQVYRKFIELCGLDEIHKNHLISERKLSQEEINKGMFFTIQNPKEIIKDLVKYVELNGLSLNGVPGFYERTYYGKWQWSYGFFVKNEKPLAIPVFNEQNEIVGIQYRFEENVNNVITKKYVWFSSNKYLSATENTRNGMAINVPIGHIQSDTPNNSIFITEGTFKGLCLSKHTNMNGLILSGVGLQKDIVSEVQKAIDKLEKKDIKVKNIFVAFDADFKQNFSVYSYLKTLCETLIKKFGDYKIIIMSWEENEGKGIDDLIINGQIKTVERVSPIKLIKTVDSFTHTLPNQKNLKANTSKNVEKMFKQVFTQIKNS